MVLNFCSRRHQVYDEQRGHPIPGISHASGGVSDLQKAEKRNASFYVSGSNSHEQSSKLPNTKICIRWTLVFIKCKKLSLAMGPFQIAIPHVELHEC